MPVISTGGIGGQLHFYTIQSVVAFFTGLQYAIATHGRVIVADLRRHGPRGRRPIGARAVRSTIIGAVFDYRAQWLAIGAAIRVERSGCGALAVHRTTRGARHGVGPKFRLLICQKPLFAHRIAQP